jgi:hypothetical protein
MFKPFPYQGRKYDDYRHIVAFKPNGCIQIDKFIISEKLAKEARLAENYMIGVDVYSRYSCIYVCVDDYGKPSKGKTFVNFINTIELFTEILDMIVADAEFDVKDIRNFCKENNIKLVIIPTGTINTNSVVEKMIDKIKTTLTIYLWEFSDVIEERVQSGIDPVKHSYKVMNSILYYLNRKFHTAVKGIPIELYMGIESPALPITNPSFLKYPEFEPGQYVLLRPRGRAKSYAFKARSTKPGIPGIIQRKAEGTKHTYIIQTNLKSPNNVINAKWYEFVPITKEEYEKAIKIPLFK